MSTLKCKMCGGTIEFEQGVTVCTCDYCGTKQTLPRLDDERKANLYDRANHFRRNNDYDKAMSIYEQILNEDNTDAESYWSIVLCKYGIEYVEDPATHKRVPTVNRAQFTSVVADEDYKNAIKYATIEQKIIYEEEAKAIDDIQKGILEISQKEEPFDVFICYKETDNDGRRTRDSVLATDLYHQLVQEGFKVFFSRITLEDKLGTAYEPYIFAALHSAKVMVVLGTKPEFFNAVWVKNEWSRYLALIRKGEKKMLIPAYRDMDPYDLPEEFSHLQAQDMSKLGFMQDLIRGIKKIISSSQPKPQVVTQQVAANNYGANVTALLKRGDIALEDGEWEKADGFFEEVLNNDAECAEAYWGKFLAKKHAKNTESFFAKVIEDTERAEYVVVQACRPDTAHIDEMVREYVVDGYLSEKKIREKYEYDLSYKSCCSSREAQKKNVLESIRNDKLFVRVSRYSDGKLQDVEVGMGSLETILDDRLSRAMDEDMRGKKKVLDAYAEHISRTDSEVVSLSKARAACKETNFQKCIDQMNDANDAASYKEAADSFMPFLNYKNGSELRNECLRKIDELKKDQVYDNAVACESRGGKSGYEEAIELYSQIPGWRNSDERNDSCKNSLDELVRAEKKAMADALAEQARRKKKKTIIIASTISFGVVAVVTTLIIVKVIIPSSKYNKAMDSYNNGQYDEAISGFTELGDYSDSSDMMQKSKFAKAQSYYEAGNYEEAINAFSELGDYKNSQEMILKCKYDVATLSYNSGDYDKAIEKFTNIVDYSDSSDMIQKCKYAIANASYEAGKYEDAINGFTELGSYDNSEIMIKQCKYVSAIALHDSNKIEESITELEKLGSYKDSDMLISQYKYELAEQFFNIKKYSKAMEYLSEIADDNSEAKALMDKCLPHVEVGDIIPYGNYDNRKRWVVVSKSNNKALLVSCGVVGNRRFDVKTNKWSKSEIRKWLNSTYYQEAFVKKEKSRIISTNGDKVFLLSISEYNKYKKWLKDVVVGGSAWWLRSPGAASDCAAYVLNNGIVNDTGTGIVTVTSRLHPVDQSIGVRPAMWIDLSK